MSVIVVYNHLPRVISVVIKDHGEIAHDVAKGMKNAAERYVPVLSGALKNSIHIEGGGDNFEVVARSIEGGAPRDYAHFVEYGTSKMNAQPFMTPAYVNGLVTDLPVAARKFGAKVEAAA